MAEPVNIAPPDVPAAGRPWVVGIGASAGGVTALQRFFAAVEPQSGAAYLVVLHLSPDHDSQLAEVLQSVAPMPVTKVTGTTAIVADHVYVAPPDKRLGIADGMLTVEEITDREQRLAPVDALFRTLADAHGPRAACVVLSGTGPNGSAGLKRIKEYGGLAIAQDPAEAEYADMPRNAIATGFVDVISPVADIPRQIREYFDSIRRKDAPVRGGRAGLQPDGVREALALLRLRTGHDFSNYKAATVQRRIERRMTLRAIDDLPAYVRLLHQDSQEATALMKELLISVTNFFRDRQAWTALETRVIPRLFVNRRPEDQVRVWVPGCATGEEAYSIAMLLAEYASTMTDPPALQLFATDLDQASIERAREGVYSESDAADVREDRLQRFFHREIRGYRVRRDLRELVLFATHNVIKDPPFSHLDLISCRNVLIYLNRSIQERVIETFHFALRPGGYLFTGGSETPDGPSDLFLRFDADAHIFESRSVTTRIVPRSETTTVAAPINQPLPVELRPPDRIAPADLHQRLLEQYAPPSLIANEELHVVHMSDRAGRYLRIRGGEPTRDLLLLARPELRTGLRGALQQAARDRVAVEVRGLNVVLDDGRRQVDILVKPVLREADPTLGFFVVLFDERAVDAEARELAAPILPLEPVMQQLEDELSRVNGQLRSTIDQYETQAEEAKASNEELQAMNEELRSAAEELETSKEELQSVNEELTTLNQELKTNIEELGHVNNDFHNFINATDIGTIFLDRRLHVKFSTPRAREVFHLLESDIGRPLSDITNTLRDVAIHQDVHAVLERLVNVEREVQTEDNRWHLLRILPYRTGDNRIDGVVITFQDVTARRTAELRERLSNERLRLLIDTALEYAMFTLDDRGEIDSWNPGAQRMFGYTPEEIIGADARVLFTPDDRADGAHLRELAEAARTGRAIDERYHVRKDGSLIYCSGVMRRLANVGSGFAKIMRDLTPQRAAAEALQRAHDELEARVGRRTAELATEVREHQEAKAAITNLLRRLVTSQEDERRRIARDLHDDMGQRVTALRLLLERAQRPADPSERVDGIADALRMTAELGGDLDFLAWQLRPAVLDELGLAAALPQYIVEWSAHVGIPAEFRFGGYQQGQLSADAEVVFYRVAQEALNNVAKHAQASRVDVVLGASDGHVVLVVEDDGIGFETASEIGATGFGLLGMRERAALSGAVLQAESSPGRGTSVFLRRPIEPVGATLNPS